MPNQTLLPLRLRFNYIQRGQRRLEVAEQRAAAEKTDDALALSKRIRAEVNRAELDIYTARSDRNPTNAGLKYELGVRLKKAGKFNDSIRCLQAARGDATNTVNVLVELGECFQHIKQYKLALSNYQQAVAAAGECEDDARKLALYRAGKLALGLRDADTAEKHLTELAGLDFGYKDVAECLDKVSHLRNKEGS